MVTWLRMAPQASGYCQLIRVDTRQALSEQSTYVLAVVASRWLDPINDEVGMLSHLRPMNRAADQRVRSTSLRPAMKEGKERCTVSFHVQSAPTVGGFLDKKTCRLTRFERHL